MTEPQEQPERKDFFVSYTGADRAWAEWIAWVLEEKAKCSVIIQAWDFHAGENFIDNMHEALEGSDRILAVLSAAYFDCAFCKQEWSAAQAKAAKEGKDKLLPVRITNIDPPGVFAPLAYVDLFDTGPDEAARRLLSGVKRERGKPDTAPRFPGQFSRSVPEQPRFPGALPAIWNVPHRNPHFTGREALISDLRGKLTAGTTTAVTQSQAITGPGGIGKSELAMEYAYRFSGDYALVWWMRAEDRATLVADVIALARELDLQEKDEARQEIVVEAVRRWVRTTGGWLLIYDNVPNEHAIEDFVPRGATGHVIITSQATHWNRIASPLAVDLWKRGESVAFLRERTGESDEGQAKRLAGLLGDLPLALEQAAAYVNQTQKPLAWYADQLEKGHGAKLWAKDRDAEKTVAATWTLSFERVAAESPAGAAPLQLCAFLAPNDIPLDVIRAGAKHLPEPLKAAAEDDIDFEDAVNAVLRYSLARRDGETLSIHRLVQAVTRDGLDEKHRKIWAELATKLMRDALPGWPHNAFDARVATIHDRLLPHALAAAAHAQTANVGLEQASGVFNAIGFYQKMRADLAGALANYQRSLAIVEKAFGPDHPNVAIRVKHLGMVLKVQGDLKGARKNYERALAIDEKAFGPDHPEVAADVNNLGGVLQDQGDLEGARKNYERALAIDEKAFGSDHPSVARDVNNLGLVLQDQGDLEGAEKSLERALAIAETAFVSDHPKVASVINNLGRVLQDQGHLEGARANFERALAIDEKAFGSDHPEVAADVNNLGWMLQDQGDLEGARRNFERALAILRGFFPEDHPHIQIALQNLEALGD